MAGHCALTTGSYRRGGDKNVDWELVALRYISGSSVLDTVSHLGPRLPSERWQSQYQEDFHCLMVHSLRLC